MGEHGHATTGGASADDTVPPHHWMRYIDPDTGEANHWCIYGDTEHHPEPCKDADARTGDHADDPPNAAETWRVLEP